MLAGEGKVLALVGTPAQVAQALLGIGIGYHGPQPQQMQQQQQPAQGTWPQPQPEGAPDSREIREAGLGKRLDGVAQVEGLARDSQPEWIARDSQVEQLARDSRVERFYVGDEPDEEEE